MAKSIDFENPVEMPEWFTKRVGDMKGVKVGDVLEFAKTLPDTLQVMSFTGEGDTGESPITIVKVQGKVTIMDVGTRDVKNRAVVVSELIQLLEKFDKEERLYFMDNYITKAEALEEENLAKEVERIEEYLNEEEGNSGDKVFEPIILVEPTSYGSRGMAVMSLGFHWTFSSWVDEDDTVEEEFPMDAYDHEEDWELLTSELKNVAQDKMDWRYKDYVFNYWSPFGEGKYEPKQMS